MITDRVLDLDAGLPALTSALVACAAAVEDERTQVSVLRLEGGGTRWPGPVEVAAVNRWERALRRWERLDALTVAVAEGTVGGPALEVLGAADVRLAGPGLSLLGPGAADSAAWPGMLVYRLTHRLGQSATRRLLLADRTAPMDADSARARDLVDEIVTDPDIRIKELAEHLGEHRTGTGMVRDLVQAAAHTSFEEALGVHLAACDRVLRRTP